MSKYKIIAASLSEKRRNKKKSEQGISMEPPFDREVQSSGPELSDARDALDSGGAEKPSIPDSTDKGSPEHVMKDDMNLSEEIMELIRNRKKKFIKE